MIAISNINLVHEESLTQWIDCVLKLPTKTWLVVAIDEQLRDYCKERGINHYFRPVRARSAEPDPACLLAPQGRRVHRPPPLAHPSPTRSHNPNPRWPTHPLPPLTPCPHRRRW